MDCLFASIQKTISRVRFAVLSGDSTKQTPSGLDVLSDEVLLRIANLLADRDKLSFRLSCKKTCAVIGSTATSLSITNVLAVQVLTSSNRSGYSQRLMSRFPTVQHLQCAATGNIIRAFFHKSQKSLSNIVSLNFAIRTGLTDNDLLLALRSCPNLLHLGLDAFAFEDPFSALNRATQLSSLSLRLCKSSLFAWDDHLLGKLSTFPHLRKLELHAQGLVKSEGISHICQCSSLESISLHQLRHLSAFDIQQLASLHSLNFLQMHECSVQHPDSLSLLCSLPDLRTLSLHVQSAANPSEAKPVTHTSSFIASLPQLTNLRSLSLEGYLETTGRQPATLTALTAFHLRGPTTPVSTVQEPHTDTPGSADQQAFPTSGLTAPSKQLFTSINQLPFLSALREVSLTKWYYLDAGILRMLPRIPYLQLLHIACLKHIADDDLLSLGSLTKLKSLKLSVRENTVTADGSAKLRGLLWGLETYELGQENS